MVRSRSEWYYVCYCRRAQGRRVFRVSTTKQARLRDETFAPRPDVELDLYRREGVPASEAYAPASATVWYSAKAARYVEELQPVDRLAGRRLRRAPALRRRALAHPLPAALRRRGAPLAPPEAVAALTAAVARLLARYGTERADAGALRSLSRWSAILEP